MGKSHNGWQAKTIEAELTELLDPHKVRLLELGAPGRLLISGKIEEVLPLDDAAMLDQANPITPTGKVQLGPVKLMARQEAQVKAVLDKGNFGLIVLSGSHDLSKSVRRLDRGQCE